MQTGGVSRTVTREECNTLVVIRIEVNLEKKV